MKQQAKKTLDMKQKSENKQTNDKEEIRLWIKDKTKENKE